MIRREVKVNQEQIVERGLHCCSRRFDKAGSESDTPAMKHAKDRDVAGGDLIRREVKEQAYYAVVAGIGLMAGSESDLSAIERGLRYAI